MDVLGTGSYASDPTAGALEGLSLRAVPWALPATAATLVYGDMDVLGTGSYASDPTAGATLEGLSPGSVTFGAPATSSTATRSSRRRATFGTDRIYVGSVQTGAHDGYSSAASRIDGPQIIELDYAALVPAGHALLTLTLGIAADDFQFPSYGQPFAATLNGRSADALTAALNGVDLGGPVVRFLTIGVDPAIDDGSHVLRLAIDQGGDGGDGWAVDYLTLGVTTAPVPEPASALLMALSSARSARPAGDAERPRTSAARGRCRRARRRR